MFTNTCIPSVLGGGADKESVGVKSIVHGFLRDAKYVFSIRKTLNLNDILHFYFANFELRCKVFFLKKLAQ